MEHTWRWFGPNDPITLKEIKQTGATGIVTALHEIPNGEVWPLEAVRERKALIEAAGLSWSVVESVPVHEDIKQGKGERDRHIANYQQTLRNLAACGIDIVCYNFMPILDWTRTDLAFALPDGGWALRFDQDAFAAFDLFILMRPGSLEEYSDLEITRARMYAESLDEAGRAQLVSNIIAGLPGSEQNYTPEQFLEVLADYAAIDEAKLRDNMTYFLRAVVPVAEEVGVRMAVHPDDPPRPLLGLPRIVSTAADVQWLLDTVPSPANGLTFCTGSYGVREDNDLVEMAMRFADKIYFVHLRATTREPDEPRSFHEAHHLAGNVDMVGVIQTLVKEERRRNLEGGPCIPLRPDHGHQLLDDQHKTTNPGYSMIGRLKGLAEIRGVELAVSQLTS
ncbi:mannonate dehydratase [Phytohalomonas tamaricis]|uniref:mannonate dehydratase n=1 Tax=Phytohalomonas tamaricis TaxID=2081032 RepID=UPI000D0B7D32|nr:mannonate dehydratase [Phytohalomonas tamaricis]